MPETIRIAVWSGPRNISTAMMRSWEARGDCAVVDEPLYAHYLAATGHDHPGAAEVMAQHETDWRIVVDALLGPVPGEKPLFYQKHMAHHLLPDIELDWIESLRNVLLIREPRAMVTSLAKVIPNPTIEETGLPQQVRLAEWLSDQTGRAAPVIDSRDVLMNPEVALRAMCDAIAVPFTQHMLTWAPGPRATDGVWAKHWYANVEKTSGFEPYVPSTAEPPARLRSLVRACERLYEPLHERRLIPV